jgi:hypothetical protein
VAGACEPAQPVSAHAAASQTFSYSFMAGCCACTCKIHALPMSLPFSLAYFSFLLSSVGNCCIGVTMGSNKGPPVLT